MNLPIDQLKPHPQQQKLFKPLADSTWVEFYTDVNARGIQQPVVISDRTGEFVIADGHQRVRAAKYLGWAEVPCIMGEFASELDEVRCLVMNNVQRRQLTREEVEKVIQYWLVNFTHHSNRRIATEIGVNHETVEAKRVDLETGGEIRYLNELEGKDGKMYPRTKPKASRPTPETAPRPVVIDTPLKAPGDEPTEARKKLERAADILTRLDVDEVREELQRDPLGTLRAYVVSATRQMQKMIEESDAQKTITVETHQKGYEYPTALPTDDGPELPTFTPSKTYAEVSKAVALISQYSEGQLLQLIAEEPDWYPVPLAQRMGYVVHLLTQVQAMARNKVAPKNGEAVEFTPKGPPN